MAVTKLVNVLELEDKLYAKFPRIPDAEYNKLIFDTEICDREVCMIQAYAIYEALKMLKADSCNKAVRVLERDLGYGGRFDWASTWQYEFTKESKIQGKTKIEYAIKHLQKVVEYHKTHYNSVYNQAFLLDFDEVLCDTYKTKYEGGYNNGRKTYSGSNNY